MAHGFSYGTRFGGKKSDVWLILDTKTTWFILGKFGDAWLHKGRKLSKWICIGGSLKTAASHTDADALANQLC